MKKRFLLFTLCIMLVSAIAIGCRPVERPVPEQQPRQVIPAPGDPLPGGGRTPGVPGPEEDLLPGRQAPQGTPGRTVPEERVPAPAR